jgi:hypothetical protein
MRFVLIYDGPLPPNGSPQDKHAIRKQFHPQLQQQWKVDPSLTALTEGTMLVDGFPPPEVTQISREGFNFRPLVTGKLHLVCSLDITFLRPEEPGDLVKQGGDIDNRIKTLLDSLSVPPANQIVKFTPDAGEDPFYCLLEDDCLVTGLSIKTERLLRPPTGTRGKDVHLDVVVVVRPTRVTLETANFLGGQL